MMCTKLGETESKPRGIASDTWNQEGRLGKDRLDGDGGGRQARNIKACRSAVSQADDVSELQLLDSISLSLTVHATYYILHAKHDTKSATTARQYFFSENDCN